MPANPMASSMLDQDIDDSSPRDEAAPSSDESVLPTWLKVIVAVVFGGLAVVALTLLFRYALRPDAKPSDSGLGTVLVFCLTMLAIIFVPWDSLGLRLSKIGFLEFTQVIKTQKKEQSDSITYLQDQIDALKQALGTEQGITGVEQPPSFALPVLLKKFLDHYRGRFFSPWTIQNWGAKQQGFQQLGSFSKEEISQVLVKMLSANQLRTKISKRGNTLFGVSRHER